MLCDEKLHVSLTLRQAMQQLMFFCQSTQVGILDMHLGNFMQRANGDLVLTDPICDDRLLEKATMRC
ncbi:MAG: hypothetical protein ACYC3W_07020 [Candidatus Nanopelagicales bacterium]